MKTKRIIALGLSAVCLVGLLCGCKGKDTQTDDGATTSASSVAVDVEHGDEALKEIKSLNDPLALLEQFKTVEVDSSIHDKTGTEISHITIQYTRNDDGYLQTATHLKYNASDYADASDYYTNTSMSASTPPAVYTVSENQNYMVCYPTSEFESMVDKELICWFTDTTDTVQNVTDQDGFKTVEVKSVSNEDDTYYYICNYTMDSDSLILQALDITAYAKADTEGEEDTVASTITYSFKYDGEYAPDGDTSTGAIGGDGAKCTLTLVINPGADDEETQTFKVNQGTNVSFNSEHSFEAFASKDMKTAMENVTFDTSGKSATYYIRLSDESAG